MPKAGKKSSGGGQKRTADDSSPAKSNRTQPANEKANLSDKEKEIDLLKHQLNEQNKIIIIRGDVRAAWNLTSSFQPPFNSASFFLY